VRLEPGPLTLHGVVFDIFVLALLPVVPPFPTDGTMDMKRLTIPGMLAWWR
jgi:hypothetical protein